jgi:peptide/nickel transport system substrate-binding protein
MVLNRKSFSLLFLLLLTACSGQGTRNGLFPTQAEEDAGPSSLSTPAPPQVLSICLGQEPESLFLYGDLSKSADIIRQAIYDGPVDRTGFEYSSPVLEQIPSLENGLVNLSTVEVLPGERMVDAHGNITILASGVEYRPAGCTSSDCWEIFESQPSIELDQVVVTFQIRSGLVWSDGSPLTAEDSLFSYQAASAVYGSVGPTRLRYAAGYQVDEDGQLLWLGLPGYQGIISYPDLFFSPLPAHLWSNYSREELLTSAQTTLSPLGWGPYKVLEWVRGDHLTLEKNPFFAGVSLGLPHFDYLVFRFVEGGEEILAAFASGECQLALNEPGLSDFTSEMLADQDSGKLQMHFNHGTAWEQLSFGIDPLDRRLRILADLELRKAIARCLDREGISRERLDAGPVVDGLYLSGDPRYTPGEEAIVYDPTAAGLSLKELGWVDDDGDPATPRLAEGVEGIPDGTPLVLDLLAGDDGSVSAIVSHIAQDLQSCGVGVEIQRLPASELLAPGPEGPVFGRKFDLALFAWAGGNYQPCRLFLSDEVPGLYPEYTRGWGGVNASGFRNDAFDQACLTVLTNLPDAEISSLAQQELNMVLSQQLPAIPLYFRQDILIADPALMGVTDDVFPLLGSIEGIEWVK